MKRKLIKLLYAVAALAISSAAQSAPEALVPGKVLALQGQTDHVQGIDTDGVHIWVTSVDRATRKGHLYQFSMKDGSQERSLEVQDGDRYHPGGLQTDATSIWMPVAEYRAKSTAIIQRRSKKTLEVEFQFSVPDHIGCIAVTPEFIIGGNWDSRDFYVWDHRGNLVRKVSSETSNSYQEIKFAAGQIVGSGTLAGRQGAVDWLDPTTFRLIRRLPIGNTEKGEPYTREGMAVFNNQLLFLPEDNSSRLFFFRLP